MHSHSSIMIRLCLSRQAVRNEVDRTNLMNPFLNLTPLKVAILIFE